METEEVTGRSRSQLEAEITTLKERMALLEEAARQHEQEKDRFEGDYAVLRELFDSAPDPVFLEDQKIGIVDCNRAACELFGYTKDELLTMNAFDLSGDDLEARLPELMEDIAQTGQTRFEMLNTKRDGSTFPSEVTVRLVEINGRKQAFTVLRDISERKAAARALEKSERMFRALTDNLAAQVYIYSAREDRCVYANPAAVVGTGYSLEELISADSPQILDDDSNEMIERMAEAMLRGDDVPDVVNTTIITKDGSKREMEATWTIIDLDDEGMFKVAMAFDVTDRKQAERRLRESEERYRALVESSPIPVMVHSQGEVVYVNNFAAKTFGVDNPEDVIGTKVMDVIHPDSTGLVARNMKAIYAGAEVASPSVIRFVKKTGEVRDAIISGSACTFDGEPAAQIVLRDITTETQAMRAMEESERRYRAIFETTGTCTIIFGDDGVINLANDQFTALTGWSREEVEGKHHWKELFTEESVQMVEELSSGCQKCHEDEACDPTCPVLKTVMNKTVRVKDKQGRIHEGIISIANIPGTRDKVASFQDLTDLKQAERQMFQADKMAALGQIIAGVAHEINNPNNFIYFNLPILRKYIDAMRPLLEHHLDEEPDLALLGMSLPDLLEDMFKLLDNMEHGSKRITAIVSELKSYIRSDENTDLRPGDLRNVVDQVMALIGKQVRKMVKRFDLNVAEDLPQISMNPGKIEQVIINLVINAGQAADKDDSWIELQVQGDPNWVTITVRDNGAGISMENQTLIFEPFFTSKSREAGTGLGLSISAKIVEDHGGTISVESEPAVGTSFVVKLPSHQEK